MRLGTLFGLSGALVALFVSGRSSATDPQVAVTHQAHAHDEAALRITLSQALELSGKRGLGVASALENERGAAETERRSRALLVRPPELTVTAGPRFSAAKTSIDASVLLLQPLSLSGAGGARSRAAEARSALARAQVLAMRNDVALAAGVAWVNARIARELIELRRRSLHEAEVLDALARERVASGAATAGERAASQALVATARASLLEAEGQAFASAALLALEIGASPAPVQAVGPLGTSPASLTEAEVLAAAGGHPGLRAMDSAARALSRDAEQTRAAGGPVLSVGPSLAREGTGDVIVLAHVSVPLPFVNPNELEAADAQRLARVARAEVVEQQTRVRVEAVIALHERRHAELVRDALLNDAIPLARVAVEEASLRYREGKGLLQEVVTARRALIEVQERHLGAAAQARVAELKLMALVGRLRGGRG
jgi:outer membrane protein TolC